MKTYIETYIDTKDLKRFITTNEIVVVKSEVASLLIADEEKFFQYIGEKFSDITNPEHRKIQRYYRVFSDVVNLKNQLHLVIPHFIVSVDGVWESEECYVWQIGELGEYAHLSLTKEQMRNGIVSMLEKTKADIRTLRIKRCKLQKRNVEKNKEVNNGSVYVKIETE